MAQRPIQPSDQVEHLFRRGKIARAAQRWRLESMTYLLGVEEQEVLRVWGKPPLEKEPPEVVYLVGTSVPPVDGEPVKIGYARNLALRIENLQAGSIKKLHLISFLRGGLELEREIHRSLAHVWIRGDWFEMCDDIRDEFNDRMAAAAPGDRGTT